MKIEECLEELSDKNLMLLVFEIENSLHIDSTEVLRPLLIKIFGRLNIPLLQIQEIMWPLVKELKVRLEDYSPYINR